MPAMSPTVTPATAPAPRPRALTRNKRLLLLALTAAILGVVGLVAYRRLSRPALVRIAPIEAGAVREEILGPGTVQSRYAVSVSARVTGTLKNVLVDVGTEVKKDQLLAEIDTTELTAKLRSAQGAVASARQDVVLARANLMKTQSDAGIARVRSDRAKNLAKAGSLSVAEADDAAAALRAAEANESAARATIAVRQAALARFIEEQNVAETVLSYATIRSPMAGIITRRALEPGAMVGTGSVLFQLVDPNALWVAALVDQSVVGRVSLGQKATIRLRSGAELAGHVARIALEADPVTREIEVDVAFDERPGRFAIHEQADVTILGVDQHGLVVPLGAVTQTSAGSGVYVVADGRVRRRAIRLGTIGALTALVNDGLVAGDTVIVGSITGAKPLRDGQRVLIEGQ